jgi:hypothetical protein
MPAYETARQRAARTKQKLDKAEAERILNFLAYLPQGQAAAPSNAVVREIMLQTGGSMLANGCQYDVKSKSLGGGVYRITLARPTP